uniref:Uncharacterized protein n=1 Tax=Hyaloperonospora arabidopsidis (strain Emoy2) TaxID=559515 RepID=M4BAG0_HYAAE
MDAFALEDDRKCAGIRESPPNTLEGLAPAVAPPVGPEAVRLCLYKRRTTSRDNLSSESRARAKTGRTRSSARTSQFSGGWQTSRVFPTSCSVCKVAVTELSPGGRNTAVGSVEATGKYRPLPVRQLVVAVWMYPPHVEVALTEERTPICDVAKQDFFAVVGNDNDSDRVDEDVLEDVGNSR